MQNETENLDRILNEELKHEEEFGTIDYRALGLNPILNNSALTS